MPSRRWVQFALAAALILFCPRSAATQALRFDSERIVVSVEADRLHIEGTYVLANDTGADRPQRLYYPFPIDSLHPEITDISVTMSDSPLPFKQSSNGIIFSVSLPAEGMSTFHVSYTQSSLDRTGCYILMTTSTWGASLREASYEIHVPLGIELVSSSYEFESIVKKNGERIHRTVRRDFMPAADLCLRWAITGP